MAAPKVRLLLKGELVQEIPFDRPTIRIGRMKENDLVVNNLSVSRFHATLAQADDGYVLEDLGSENGIWVNGRRVKSCRVGPGDRIQVGKHEVQIVPAGETAAPAAQRGRSDAWDAAKTYVAGPDTQARMAAAASGEPSVGGEPEPLFDLDTDGELAPPEPASPPADAGAELLFGQAEGSGDLSPPDLAEFDVSELDLRDVEPPAPEPEPALASAPDELDPEEVATELVDAAPADPDPAPQAPPLQPAAAPAADGRHAGLIMQRGGVLERVIQWEGERMTLGRATECEIVLATPEVSRRHAMLVRDGDRYEVRDLESINGTFVNGEKVSRRALQVGDVVRVEDFELTFVIDHSPLGSAVKSEAPPPPQRGAPDPGLTQIGEMMDLAPFVAEESPEDAATAMSFEPLEPLEPMAPIEPIEPIEPLEPLPGEALAEELGAASAEMEAPPEPDPEPETVLLAEEAEEEKDLVESPRDARVLRFELRVRMEELPPALRDALAQLDPADLRLPVELRLTTDDEAL